MSDVEAVYQGTIQKAKECRAEASRWETLHDVCLEVFDLRRANAALTAELADYHEALKFIRDDKCSSDEQHCGCVAYLRAEDKRLRQRCEALEGAVKAMVAWDAAENALPPYNSDGGRSHDKCMALCREAFALARAALSTPSGEATKEVKG